MKEDQSKYTTIKYSSCGFFYECHIPKGYAIVVSPEMQLLGADVHLVLNPMSGHFESPDFDRIEKEAGIKDPDFEGAIIRHARVGDCFLVVQKIPIVKYYINYRFSESGWSGKTGNGFDDRESATKTAKIQMELSQQSYRKCVDANIDVDFIVEYSIIKEERD